MMKIESKIPPALLVFALVLQVATVGYIDYVSGYELRIGALYCFPVGFASWHFGLRAGIATGLASAFISWWTERMGGEVYSAEWIGWVNAASRLAIFAFVAGSFAFFRKTVALARRKVRAFEGPLPVCCACHRLDAGQGFWVDFPTYVRTNTEARPEFSLCPVCRKEGRGTASG